MSGDNLEGAGICDLRQRSLDWSCPPSWKSDGKLMKNEGLLTQAAPNCPLCAVSTSNNFVFQYRPLMRVCFPQAVAATRSVTSPIGSYRICGEMTCWHDGHHAVNHVPQCPLISICPTKATSHHMCQFLCVDNAPSVRRAARAGAVPPHL